MKELTKIFDGIEIPVEYTDEENMWFNVSGVANRFGKNIGDWKNGKRTKELLSEAEKSSSLNRSLIDDELHSSTILITVRTMPHYHLSVNFS